MFGIVWSTTSYSGLSGNSSLCIPIAVFFPVSFGMVVGKTERIITWTTLEQVFSPFPASLCFPSTPSAFLQCNGLVALWFSRRESEFQVLLVKPVPFPAQLLSEELCEYARQSECLGFVYS